MNLFKKSASPTTDEQVAVLTARRQELEGIYATRLRLESMAAQASAARAKAHGAFDTVLNKDAEAYALTTDSGLDKLKNDFLIARSVEAEAIANLQDHIDVNGEPSVGLALIRKEEDYLQVQKLKAADYADAAELVRLGEALSDLQAKMVKRRHAALHRWPEAEMISDSRQIDKGAGLADLAFPIGVFDVVPDAVPLRSIWRDHVLRSIGEVYPDLLPANCADTIPAKIEADRAKGVSRWWAGPTLWDITSFRKVLERQMFRVWTGTRPIDRG